jgi:hypothetical protein
MSKLSSLGFPDFHISISLFDLCMSMALVMKAHTQGCAAVCLNTTFKSVLGNVDIRRNVCDNGFILSNASPTFFQPNVDLLLGESCCNSWVQTI